MYRSGLDVFLLHGRMYLLGADSEECKAALRKIYNQAAINELIEYEEFTYFKMRYITD